MNVQEALGLLVACFCAIALAACQEQEASGSEVPMSPAAAGTTSAAQYEEGVLGQEGMTAQPPAAGGGSAAPQQPITTAPTSGTAPASTPQNQPQDQPTAGSGPATMPATEPQPPQSQGPDAAAPATPPTDLEPFSFFVTSLEVMRELSGSDDGFGGDLGGLEGADRICQQAAERVGFAAKTWRAFLSATDGGGGQPVHAIDRIGDGPWYDRNGRLIAEDKAGLLHDRPAGDAQVVEDLPNEHGEGQKAMGDNHDVLTGTNPDGQLAASEPERTCNDWTSTTVSPGEGGRRGSGGVQLGHSWPAGSGAGWMTAHTVGSCEPGVNLVQGGGGSGVGALGGYGAIYCFALTP